MSFETINLLAPAFVAGVLVSLALVPLGQEVLKRGIIFLDLAVAQFAALGMLAFQVFFTVDEYSGLGMYGPLASGLIAALVCAFTFHVLEKRAGRYQEALIGCAFVLAASLSLLLMSNDPHGGEQIKNVLEGQILWIDWSDLRLATPIFAAVFMLWVCMPHKRETMFYVLFALCVPFAVNLIGVYLVFASLIFPALAVLHVKTKKIPAGVFVSVCAYMLGLVLSYWLDWPSGPAIVVAMVVVTLLCFFVAPEKGEA